MYQRTIKLYRGIDNLVKFTFKNSDQKRVNVDGWDIYFNITSDTEGAVLVTKQATVIGNPVQGEVTVAVSELDLLDLVDEFYGYSLSVRDPISGIEQVIYTDDNYDARGEIHLKAGHYPMVQKSIQVQLPTSSNTTVTSSIVTSDTPTRQQSKLHTSQFYFNNFTGVIDIQATLDALPPNGNTSANTSVSWATVSTISFTNQSDNSYRNVEGIFSAMRYVITPVTGAVTNILYRA